MTWTLYSQDNKQIKEWGGKGAVKFFFQKSFQSKSVVKENKMFKL